MKNRKCFGLLMLLLLAPFAVLKAQFLPIVYDRVHYPMTSYSVMLQSKNGDVRLMGPEASGARYLKASGDGNIAHSKLFPNFTPITAAEDTDGSMLIVGGKDGGQAKAQFLKITNDEKIDIDYQHANNGYFNQIIPLRNGGYLLGGFEWLKGSERKAFAVVLSAAGKLVSTIDGTNVEQCAGIAESSDGSYVVVFSSEVNDTRVIRFAPNGRQLFAVAIPGVFKINQMKQSRFGEFILIGATDKKQARVVKMRPEGAVVFDKVLPSANSSYTHLELSNQDEILIGGSIGSEGYLQCLRNDGTELYRIQLVGPVSSMGFSPRGSVIAAAFNPAQGRGIIMKVSTAGQVLYDRETVANFDYIYIDVDGETTLLSTTSGRVTKFNEDGGIITDKQVDKSENPGYLCSGVGENGDIVLAGRNGRITKLAHGLMVGDIRVQKPINGFALANFTVTLTGFQRQNGIPSPVTVYYKVVENSAKFDKNIIQNSGLLSFVPSDFGNGEFMVEQTVEVPVLANSMLEGNRNFFLVLENPENSYLVKGTAEATISDQPAMVRFISSIPGREPSTPITYSIGLFKSDGSEITNVSGSDVIVRGVFGKGTAGPEDFNASKAPLFVVSQGKSQATFQVDVVSDDRYEVPETVILSLNQVQGMSDVRVQLEGGTLNCTGLIYDQPAYLMLSPLGDKGRLNSNTGAFFRAMLVRASDDRPLINCTGSNILITTEVDDRGTAVKGEDFVLVNETDLLIPGDCQRGTANIQGVVLANPSHTGSVSVGLSLVDVTVPENAGELKIHPTKGSASFNITPTRRK